MVTVYVHILSRVRVHGHASGFQSKGDLTLQADTATLLRNSLAPGTVLRERIRRHCPEMLGQLLDVLYTVSRLTPEKLVLIPKVRAARAYAKSSY